MRVCTLVLFVLTGCGVTGAEGPTDCGMDVVVGLDVAEVQKLERMVGKVFAMSADTRLHDVCAASRGFTVQLVDFIPDPRRGHEGETVSGRTLCDSRRVLVVDALYLPHELAHVAQRCADDSAAHEGWDTDVFPVLGLLRACLDDERYEAARDGGPGCSWMPGGCPTICPAGVRQ